MLLFFLVKKSNQKRQAKNMLSPPLGKLRFSRSACTALKSCFPQFTALSACIFGDPRSISLNIYNLYNNYFFVKFKAPAHLYATLEKYKRVNVKLFGILKFSV
jgi:hypothetical protein